MSRPTYIVAVAGGDIKMGYSPTSLQLTTNGENALVDTPEMQMQDGPPSPNDGSTKKFHRFMYFVDGTQYKRLDAHTGIVEDWTAFVGTDVRANEAIDGVLPFEEDYFDDIVSNTASTFVVAGDVTDIIADGDEVLVQGSTGANGSYTVSGAPVFSSPNTTITVAEAVPDTTGDGNLSHVTGRSHLIALWHDRLVLTIGPIWFMSAVGDPRNWEYGPATPSVTQAVAGNLSEAGEVAEDIVALVPITDDILWFGCQNSLWVLQGDPAAGGQLINVSRQIGMQGPDCWSFDNQNRLLFMGTDGLYRYSPGAGLEKLSEGRLDTTFRAINLEDTRVLLEWDRRQQYLYIFLSKETGENPDGYIYDDRSDAFWPIDLPDTNGPQSTYYFEADDFNDTGVMLGGRDGIIRTFRDRRPNDSSTTGDVAIDSFVLLAPFQIDPFLDTRLIEARFKVADNSGPVTFELFGGATAEQASTATQPRVSHTFRSNQTRTLRRRVTANALSVKLSQNALFTTWAMDGGDMIYEQAGRTRRER